jgi:hypothetical protein
MINQKPYKLLEARIRASDMDIGETCMHDHTRKDTKSTQPASTFGTGCDYSYCFNTIADYKHSKDPV